MCCFLLSVFAREVLLEGVADPAKVPCASIGRSVGLCVCVCVCVCVCMCFVLHRYMDLRMDLPLRGVQPLANPPEHSSAGQ